MPSTLRDQVCDAVRSAGADAVGVAGAEPFDAARERLEANKAAGLHGGMQFTYRNPARSTDPARALPGARSLVVAALHYRRADGDERPAGAPPWSVGTIARYAREDFYASLRAALAAGEAVLEGAGHRARVLVDDNALVDRAAAVRAGLGWAGKNSNVLLPGAGSWFVLGSLLTDADLGPADPPVEDGCGPCTACIPACPTDAIVAPGVVDARRCLAWLVEAGGDFPREHRVALGGRVYGCDDCQEVCPPNRIAERRAPSPPASADAEATADLLWMLRAGDDDLLARHGRWYIADRDPRHLRRNALIALGNVGDPTQPEVVRAVADHVESPDPLLRRHAVWAAARLGLDDLLRAAADDPDASVRDELRAVTLPLGD